MYEITGKNPNFKDLNDIKDIDQFVHDSLIQQYQQKESWLGSEHMREIERQLLLYIVDNKWKDHLYSLDQLKEGIGLRGYAQTDPLLEYQREGFQMFDLMLASIKEEVIGFLFKIQITPMTVKPSNSKDAQEDSENQGSPKTPSKTSSEVPGKERKNLKIGRNDLCPCGSGKKFKKCCGGKA
jgi:preprotein translocase subunit SecA